MSAPSPAAYDLIDQAIYAVTTNHNYDALVILAKLKDAWRVAQHEEAEAAARQESWSHAPDCAALRLSSADCNCITPAADDAANAALASVDLTVEPRRESDRFERYAAELAQDHRRGSHRSQPWPSCTSCIETQNSLGLHSGNSTCFGSYSIVAEGEYQRQDGSGAWAATVCPACSRKVGASRPTKRVPWVVVGRHNAKGAR